MTTTTRNNNKQFKRRMESKGIDDESINANGIERSGLVVRLMISLFNSRLKHLMVR